MDKQEFYKDTQHNMLRRCANWDYKSNAIYMLTIVTSNRSPILGTLVNTGDSIRVEPTDIGLAVSDEIEHLHNDFRMIEVITYQIMPDHVHILLHVHEQLSIHLGRIVARLKAQCSHRYDSLINQRTQNQTQPTNTQNNNTQNQNQPTAIQNKHTNTQNNNTQNQNQPTAIQNQPTNTQNNNTQNQTQPTAIQNQPTNTQNNNTQNQNINTPSMPSGSVLTDLSVSHNHQPTQPKATTATKQPYLTTINNPRPSLFANGYNDRILFHKGQLDNMVNYIKDNPRRLWLKRNNPDLFTILDNIRIGDYTFSAIGNRFLLDSPIRLQIQCSRKLTQQEISTQKDLFLAAGRHGAVLVSPCISEGERQIATAALENGVALIVLLENGFAPQYKPIGRYFNACVEGRLLMLAPWEHHIEKQPITRLQCLKLNEMAKYIANKENN